MAITRGIKDKLNKYGLNLPVDRRTRAYANLLQNNNWTETQYVSYLKQTLKKYTKKEKKFVRQVQDTNYRLEVAEKVRQRKADGDLPIPKFDQDQIEKMKGSLPYPPEGSVKDRFGQNK